MAPRRKAAAPKSVATAKAASAAAPPPAGTMTSPAAEVQNRALPKKEAELFRQVLTLYETKQFQKGLKTVEQILKPFPDHGECLSMRGLFLSCMDRKPEGYAQVDRAVEMDPGSHIVWHVYALMLRADKKFEQALECYRKATTIEPDSLNLLTDMAMLLVHLRHYTEYAAARLTILRTQPRLRKNWIYLAVAQHLAGQYAECDRTLTHFEAMLREVPDREFDHGELLLYHAMVLEEAGQLERCLEFLQDHSGEIIDRTAYSVQRAHLLLKLGRKEPAEWAWDILLEENPDSYEYIRASVLARDADCDANDAEGRSAAAKVLDALAEKHPRSLAIRRLTLDIVSGDEFRSRASRYLTDALSKGVPSIFADVKSLYRDVSKREMIGSLVESYRAALESSSTFGLASDADDEVESSAAYLWTLYFLAQHYSQISPADQSQALTMLDLAEAHTPSLPELSMLRARVLKRAGDAVGAMRAMQHAQSLDLQDRFLNSKLAKYLIRADRIEEAESVAGLFTKKDAPSPLSDLVDMQCLWILYEEAESWKRQGKDALALKRYHQLFEIFTEIEEDQYDFHSYCIRKSTLRAYVDMLRFADSLRSHRRYVAAAQGAIEIYLRMHDDPSSFTAPPLTNGAAAAAAATEVEEKQKPAVTAAAKLKAEQEAKEKGSHASKKAGPSVIVKGKSKKDESVKVEDEEEDDKSNPSHEDEDPLGEKLIATKEPLEMALKFLKPLEKEASEMVETWVLSYRVSIRRGKHLLALAALRRALSISPSSPQLIPLITSFVQLVQSSSHQGSSDLVQSTIQKAVPSLFKGHTTIEAFVDSALQMGSEEDERRGERLLAVVEAKQILGADVEEREELVFQVLRSETGADLETTTRGLSYLTRQSSSRIEEYRKEASRRWPLARAFKTTSELGEMDREVENKAKEAEVGREEEGELGLSGSA